MNRALSGLFDSPELYPLTVNFEKRTMTFVRMSPATYRNSVFLDVRTRRLEDAMYEARVDDVIFAASTSRPAIKPAHYIFHTTFCCSTLLARCYELVPPCFVLKEPMLLTYLALTREFHPLWNETFNLTLQLLTRTYQPEQFVIIKPHEPVNMLASFLLEQHKSSTATFLLTSLRHFLLSVLKSEERRKWIRSRIPQVTQDARWIPDTPIDSSQLTDAESAAYLWLVNRSLCKALLRAYPSRVFAVMDEAVAESPIQCVRNVTHPWGLNLAGLQLEEIEGDSTLSKYSKDLSRPFDADLRRQEFIFLEQQWGAEADTAISWANSRRLSFDLGELFHAESYRSEGNIPAENHLQLS